MPNTEAVLELRIPPEPHLCGAVRGRIAHFARTHLVDEDDLGHFLTALGEALANAIEHSNASEPIEIHCRIDAHRIVATIRDAGVGFPSVPEASLELPPADAERGRGLPIMRRCTDIFEVTSTPGGGTAVHIGRYFRPASWPAVRAPRVVRGARR